MERISWLVEDQIKEMEEIIEATQGPNPGSKGNKSVFYATKKGILKEIVQRGENTRKKNKMQVRFQ